MVVRLARPSTPITTFSMPHPPLPSTQCCVAKDAFVRIAKSTVESMALNQGMLPIPGVEMVSSSAEGFSISRQAEKCMFLSRWDAIERTLSLLHVFTQDLTCSAVMASYLWSRSRRIFSEQWHQRVAWSIIAKRSKPLPDCKTPARANARNILHSLIPVGSHRKACKRITARTLTEDRSFFHGLYKPKTSSGLDVDATLHV